MKIIRYLWYVVRHKFWVGLACLRLGFWWEAVFHDWTKLLPDEFFPYASHFGAGIHKGRDRTGYYKPTDTGDLPFEMAWLRHARRNPHHWQYWALPTEDGEKLYDVPEYWLRVMVCDWWGAGRAQRTKSNPKEWYAKNKDKIRLSPNSKVRLEALLDEIP
jgi:hypothetical protein